MDWIRSAYSPSTIFYEGGAPVSTYWYRCAKNAQVFPGPTVFTSLDHSEEIPAEPIGEQRPPRGAWRNGARPALYNGKGFFRGTLEAFEQGQQVIDLEPVGCTTAVEPLDLATGPGPFQFPESELEASENFFYPVLGIRWGYSNPTPPVDQDLNVQLWSGPPIGGADGLVIASFNPSTKAWEGSVIGLDNFGDPFDLSVTVKDGGNGVANLTFTVTSTPNYSGGTMTATLPWAEADDVTSENIATLQNATPWFIFSNTQLVGFLPFP